MPAGKPDDHGGPRPRRGRSRRLTPELGVLDSDSGESTERQVYRVLKRAIMSGVFEPGAAMTSRSIAETFGISTSPVRDALKRLEADEVLLGRQKSAYFIRLLTQNDYQDILQIRIQLEGYAVRVAAEHVTPADIAVLEDINRRYAACAADIPATLQINFHCHFQIYRLAQSQHLINIIETLWTRIGPTLHWHSAGYEIAHVTENHARLIEALRAGNAKVAQRALERDLVDAARAIIPRLSGTQAGEVMPFPQFALVD